MKENKIYLFTFALALVPMMATSGAEAQTTACPPPSTSVEARVDSTVSWSGKNKLYTYQYKLTNSKNSPLSIYNFVVGVPSEPSSPKSPANWDVDFGNSKTKRMNWGTAQPDPNKDTTNIRGPGHPEPKFFALKPGQSLSGFSFQSPYPPAMTKYFVAGDTDIPVSVATADNDEPVPDCPGWYLKGPKFDNMVSGITQGPSDPNVISVAIRVREHDGERKCGPHDPEHPDGKLGVVVLSNKTFDARTVDPASIQVGPGKASPVSFRLVPKLREKYDDEAEDWERESLSFKEDEKERAKRQNLLLVFDRAAVGLRCNLDSALFLTGKTKDGKSIAGGKAIELKGCNIKKPYDPRKRR
jgi:hypothetical protein